MPKSSKDDATVNCRYALCVGIGTYIKLTNRNLRYATADAKVVAESLADPQRGNFEKVTLLIEPAETARQALEEALYNTLKAPSLKAEDLVVIYLSCHGNIYGENKTFYLLPSDAEVEADGTPKTQTVLDIHCLGKVQTNVTVLNNLAYLKIKPEAA